MKTRHGLGVGLVGLLLSTVAFAAAPVAVDATDEAIAAAASANLVMEEIIVKARHPHAASHSEVFTMQKPLDLMSEAPIHAPLFLDLVKPDFHLTL